MLDELVSALNQIISQTKDNLTTLGLIVLTLWIIFFISRFVVRPLLLLGITPRRLYGLPGILLAPLLHADFNHLFFNTIPLVVLSNFILIYGLNYYLTVTLLITLMSGAATWLFAKRGLHIGASGVITGYWGFLVSNIYQQTSVTTLILGIVSLYYFAGIFLGIFPREKGVSWEGHLFGLLAGFATSYLMAIHPVVIQFQ